MMPMITNAHIARLAVRRRGGSAARSSPALILLSISAPMALCTASSIATWAKVTMRQFRRSGVLPFAFALSS